MRALCAIYAWRIAITGILANNQDILSVSKARVGTAQNGDDLLSVFSKSGAGTTTRDLCQGPNSSACPAKTGTFSALTSSHHFHPELWHAMR